MATILTYLGEAWCAGRLAGTVLTDGHFVGWGSGEGTAAKADTTLFAEETEDRVVGAVTVEGTGVMAAYTVVGTLTADSDKTITNAANFTATTSGTMIVKGDFEGIDLSENDQIAFTFEIDPS